jgi:thymidylate synthase (FAD)
MEIIKPQVELWIQENPIDHVARCARICYASDKTTGNNAMYNRLLDAGHNSMFRHESVYIIAPGIIDTYALISRFENCPFIDYRIDYDNNEIYISTNRQFFMENKIIRHFNKWIVSVDEFKSTLLGKEIMRYTFKVVTQISTSRELNRVSPNNIAEQSTRYVNLSKKGGAICQPHWMTDSEVESWEDDDIDSNTKLSVYLNSCEQGFEDYNLLLKLGMLPEDARGVLPIDTATVCAYTYSIKQWRDIIDLRYYGTTGKPHPNAKIIAGMIRDKLIDAGYEFRDK